MPTITAAIDKLAKFSDKENIPKIIEGLQSLQALKSPHDASDDVIEELRKELKKFLPQKNVKKDNISLADAAYDGLLALAEFKPLNEEDPITLLEISKEDKAFVSTGHQFSLTNLIHYHHTRNYRSNLGETHQSKYLLNPLDNSKFNSIEVTHISTIAKERGFTIENLKPEALFQQQATPTTTSTARLSNSNSSGSQYFVNDLHNYDNLPASINYYESEGQFFSTAANWGDDVRERGLELVFQVAHQFVQPQQLETPRTILPSSVATVLNEITGFFQRLFNNDNGLTNAQARENDFQEDRPSIREQYESFSYAPVFSSPLSQPTSSVSNTHREEPKSSTPPRPGA